MSVFNKVKTSNYAGKAGWMDVGANQEFEPDNRSWGCGVYLVAALILSLLFLVITHAEEIHSLIY